MLQQKTGFSWVALFSLMLMLTACGGDSDSSGFTENIDVRLAALEVDDATLFVGDDELEVFDPDFSGPYRVELNDPTAASFVLRATLRDESTHIVIVTKTLNDAGFFDDIEVPAESGANTTVSLDAGQNVVQVRVVNNGPDGAILNYILVIDRPVSTISAGLTSMVIVFDGRDGSVEPFRLEADVFEYNITANFAECAATFFPRTIDREAQLEFNNEPFENFSARQVTLPLGASSYELDILSQDGSENQQFTFNITRTQPTEAEAESDVTLSRISLVGGELNRDVVCIGGDANGLQLIGAIGFEQESISLDIDSTVLGTDTLNGPVVTLGAAVLADDDSYLREGTSGVEGIFFETADDIDVISGETVSGGPLDDLVVGLNRFIVDVRSFDGLARRQYVLDITRTTTNRVLVESVAELQSALRNAQPNDEIIVRAGSYQGIASEENSGHTQAHFYSNSDGTEDLPIILRSEVLGAEVTLMGAGFDENAVFLLEGDHWRVNGINFENAQTGLHLSGASNNQLNVVTVRSVGERGVVLSGGSNDNRLQTFSVDDTGMMPANTEANGASFGEGLVVMDSVNNQIFQWRFGRDIHSEQVDLKAASEGTEIRFSTFDVGGINDSSEEFSAVVVNSDEVIMAYNTFEYGNLLVANPELQNLVFIRGDAQPISLSLYQTLGDVNAEPVTFVNAVGDVDVLVADNLRLDGADVNYLGATVDTSFSTPVYYLQSAAVEEWCVDWEKLTIPVSSTVNANIDYFLALTCDQSEKQRWVLTNAGGGLVTIGQVVDGARIFIGNSVPQFSALQPNLRPVEFLEGGEPVIDEVIDQVIDQAIERITDQSVFDNSGFLRWAPVADGDSFLFLTQGFDRQALTILSYLVPKEFVDEDSTNVEDLFDLRQGLFLQPATGVTSQLFNLLPAE